VVANNLHISPLHNRRTTGSKALRKGMMKFNQVDPSLRPDTWGAYYAGVDARPLDAEEEKVRARILDGSMRVGRARRLIDNLDAATPWGCRLEFIEYLAAIAACHPEEMSYSKELLIR